jgi:hypothetical protein
MFKIELPKTVTFPMQRDAGDFELDLSKLTLETLIGLVAAGARETSGNAGGTPKEGESNADAVRNCAARIQNNEHNFGGGGGGRRISPAETVEREWIEAVLVNKTGPHKLKRADARKMVAASVAEAYAVVMPEGDYDSFKADAVKEAARRAKSVNPLQQ